MVRDTSPEFGTDIQIVIIHIVREKVVKVEKEYKYLNINDKKGGRHHHEGGHHVEAIDAAKSAKCKADIGFTQSFVCWGVLEYGEQKTSTECFDLRRSRTGSLEAIGRVTGGSNP